MGILLKVDIAHFISFISVMADSEARGDDLVNKIPAPNHPISLYFQSVIKKKTAQRVSRTLLLFRMTPSGLEPVNNQWIL